MATKTTKVPHQAPPAPLPAETPNAPDKFSDATKAGLEPGDKVYMTAVHGRIVHPNQVPLEFNVGEATRVEVDSWVIIQFEAGKLALADQD